MHTPLLKVQFCNIVMCSLCCAICHRMFNHYGSFDPLFFILLIFYYCYYFNGKFGQQLVFFQFLFFSFLWFCLHIWFFLFLFLFFFYLFCFYFYLFNFSLWQLWATILDCFRFSIKLCWFLLKGFIKSYWSV